MPFLNFKIWGGNNLCTLKKPDIYGINQGLTPLGETWEISRHRDGGASVLDSEQKLSELFSEKELPYLVKFIDTSDHLSVQVHPGDEYAKIHENDSGKTECWIILGAKEGAGIYLGLKPEITREQFYRAIEEKKQVNELLNFYPVKPGQFFKVEAGAIHAIGADVILCEVQQSSGVTYRVWDWNRVEKDGKPRALHIEKAFDVTDFSAEANKLQAFSYIENIYDLEERELLKHRDFNLYTFSKNKNDIVKFTNTSKRAVSVICFKGELSVGNETISSYDSVIIKDCATIELTCLDSCQFIIVN